MTKLFSAPTAINLEITDLCNAKCRHCYNFWRADSTKSCSMNSETMERLVNIFIDAGIFHVVLTGGEPFLNFDVLESGLRKMRANNISVSCNSNLMLATEDKLKRLRDAGLEHILTSLNCHDPKINDYMVNQKNAFKKITDGIKLAVKHGIRVSVNMIVSQRNKDFVYETGKLAHDLGCQKIFGTRVVPTCKVKNAHNTEFLLTKNDALDILNQLIRVKKETGIMIGSLVSYPLCLLGDLEKYKDFVGRGCTGQSGHIMSINANGDTHACVHQEENYGNIFEIGIQKAYKNMQAWYNKSYRYEECEDCTYIEVCRTGCRMSAQASSGKYNGKDPLMVGRDNIVRPFKLVHDETIYKKIDDKLKFKVPQRLRFRKEKGFYLVNIRWANVITVSNDTGEFLMKYCASGKEFDITDFGVENKKVLAELFFKDAVISDLVAYSDYREKAGFSVNPADLK